MSEDMDAGRVEQVRSLIRVIRFQPGKFALISLGGLLVAILEGVGVSFILPIVELVRSTGNPTDQATGALSVFVDVYRFLGLELTLGSIIVGVSIIIFIRWTLTFLVGWMQGALRASYTRQLQQLSFGSALNASIVYFDKKGSDEILNAIVTQSKHGAGVVTHVVDLFIQGLITLMYLSIAFVLAPRLTIVAVIFLGGSTYLFRYIVEEGYHLGDRVAEANENIQAEAQSAIQGIRDVKMFGIKSEYRSSFREAVDRLEQTMVTRHRNDKAISSFYNLLVAISVFVLVYFALKFADLTLGALGVFLFVMFRLGPKISSLNSLIYRIENSLPHLMRTQALIEEIQTHQEPDTESQAVPEEVEIIEFDDVSFSYGTQSERVIENISFKLRRGEFIGFVGASGAGKSTIALLLARMYEPDSGTVFVNEIPLNQMNIDAWRARVAIVRQKPFIFNNTLRYNLTLGDREVSDGRLSRICEATKVTEFLDDLPDGLDTHLGESGVRLSGGQRQRIALARALIKDAEVLILDEATSDLDSHLEEQIQQSIKRLQGEYIIINIAHNLSTVRNADRIYTIDQGEITEVGDHEELLEQGGTYSDLHSIQSSDD